MNKSLDSSAKKVADYWDKYVGSHLNSLDHWESNQVVQQFQWKYLTGDRHVNPVSWFFDNYGPFKFMASIGCGTGLLEKFVAENYLPKDGHITGYDISPNSVKIASDNAKGLNNISYEVRDVNTAEWDKDYLDVVFAHGATHHIAKLDHCLGQIRRALKPTGYLYLNDYVGPRRFQWTDAQLRLAREVFKMIPRQYLRNDEVARCDPKALKELDPSEAVRSDHILDHIYAHFDVKVLKKRGGTLLAPIFGAGCISAKLFESAEGMGILQNICEVERKLIDEGIIPSDHVLVVASPRKSGDF